jgi:predicted DNA-binding protein (UPF0251 family)
MSLPPKGKGRKSNIEAYRDAMAVVKLVDHDCMEVPDAAKALGLNERTAYRLLSRARSMLLTPQIEADKKAAEPKVNQWFEPIPDGTRAGTQDDSGEAKLNVPRSDLAHAVAPGMMDHPAPANDDEGDHRRVEARSKVTEPEPASGRQSSDEFLTLPDGTKRRVKPQQPTEDIYEWSHVMDYSVFRVKTPWRQAQLIAQWKENEVLGGKHVNLRGKPKGGPCFGSCPTGNCTCNDREDF